MQQIERQPNASPGVNGLTHLEVLTTVTGPPVGPALSLVWEKPHAWEPIALKDNRTPLQAWMAWHTWKSDPTSLPPSAANNGQNLSEMLRVIATFDVTSLAGSALTVRMHGRDARSGCTAGLCGQQSIWVVTEKDNGKRLRLYSEILTIFVKIKVISHLWHFPI